MRQLGKIAALLLVVAAAWQALMWLSVAPFRYNRYRKYAESQLSIIERAPSDFQRRMLARRIIDGLSRHARSGIHDVSLNVNRAIAYSMMGAGEAAITEYEQAISLEKRPEVYLGLATQQLRSGAREQAIQSVIRAVQFNPIHGFHLHEYFTDESFVAEVLARPELQAARKKIGR